LVDVTTHVFVFADDWRAANQRRQAADHGDGRHRDLVRARRHLAVEDTVDRVGGVFTLGCVLKCLGDLVGGGRVDRDGRVAGPSEGVTGRGATPSAMTT